MVTLGCYIVTIVYICPKVQNAVSVIPNSHTQEFTTDIAVALDSWVGMVHMVKCRLVMVSGDGSRCIMSDGEALELDDLRDTRDRVRLVTVSQAHGHLILKTSQLVLLYY